MLTRLTNPISISLKTITLVNYLKKIFEIIYSIYHSMLLKYEWLLFIKNKILHIIFLTIQVQMFCYLFTYKPPSKLRLDNGIFNGYKSLGKHRISVIKQNHSQIHESLTNYKRLFVTFTNHYSSL